MTRHKESDMLYKVVTYVRVDPNPEDEIYFESIEDAKREVEHLSSMHWDDLFQVEEVSTDEVSDAATLYEDPVGTE